MQLSPNVVPGFLQDVFSNARVVGVRVQHLVTHVNGVRVLLALHVLEGELVAERGVGPRSGRGARAVAVQRVPAQRVPAQPPGPLVVAGRLAVVLLLLRHHAQALVRLSAALQGRLVGY